MKRSLLVVGVYLCLGALGSLACAWGLSVARMMWHVGTFEIDWSAYEDSHGPRWPSDVPADWPAPSTRGAYRARGFWRGHGVTDGPPKMVSVFYDEEGHSYPHFMTMPPTHSLDVVRTGWPFLAFESRLLRPPNTEPDPRSMPGFRFVSWEAGFWWCRWGAGSPPSVEGAPLPVAPLWWGFAADSVFYSGAAWIVAFGPLALRRTLRRRRNLCPHCAYPIGTSPVCTECGKPVRAHGGGGHLDPKGNAVD